MAVVGRCKEALVCASAIDALDLGGYRRYGVKSRAIRAFMNLPVSLIITLTLYACLQRYRGPNEFYTR